MSKSVFADLEQQAFPYRFAGQLEVERLLGGVPNDPKVAEGWLRKKLSPTNEAFLQQIIAETAAERGISGRDAAKVVEEQRTINGFKRDPERHAPDRSCCTRNPECGGELYIEGRQLKAAIKEATSVAIAAGKIKQEGWGKTRKFLMNYLAEHVFVVERRLYLGVYEPHEVLQSFVHTFRGNSIKYEEVVHGAVVNFTVISDHPFTEKEWATIWLCGEKQGLGASRSQGYGTYEVTRWDAQ